MTFWVVSALSHFGPGLFRPGSFWPILVGRFGLIFLSPPRLRVMGRTIIWLFDEESSDVQCSSQERQFWGPGAPTLQKVGDI